MLNLGGGVSLAAGLPTRFVGVVKDLLDDKDRDVPPLGQALAALAPKLRGVLTTNLDRLLERAFPPSWVEYQRPQSSLATGKHFILKLHGTIQDASTWILTRDSHDRVIDSEYQALLNTLMSSAPMLFVGFGLGDADFVKILEHTRTRGQPPKHFALVPKPISPGRRRTMANLGVILVGYDDDCKDPQAGPISVLEALSIGEAFAAKSEEKDDSRVERVGNGHRDPSSRKAEVGNRVPTVSVTQKVVDHAHKTGHLGSRQIVIRGTPGGSKSAPIGLRLAIGGTTYKLTVADSHAIWRSHQNESSERDFDLLYGLLSTQPGSEVVVDSVELIRAVEPVPSTTSVQPDESRTNITNRRLARLLDRSRYWKDLTRACDDNNNHLGIVVHAASHQNLELFLERIRTYIRGDIRRRHRPWTVVMQSDFQTVVDAADWGARVREVLGDTELDFTESLEDAAEHEAAMFILADSSGRPLRCGDGELSLQQQEGLLEFLGSYLPKHLAAARTKNPLRFVIPIEYPPYGNEPDHRFFLEVCKALERASGVDYVSIGPLELPTWHEVWTSIKAEFMRDNRKPPDDVGRECRKILREMTDGGCSFAELAEAIGEVVDAAKVASS